MKVVDFLGPSCVIPALAGSSKAEVLAEMAAHLGREHPAIDALVLRRVVEERELLASTGIGDGIAIPHGRLDNIDSLVGALGRKAAGLDFDSIDGRPTYLVFMLVAPSSSTGIHLKALARLSRLFKDALFRRRLIDAADAATMYRIVEDEDAKY